MSTVSMNIPVPSSGFGLAVDVSSLVGEKTVALSGRYRGAYVLYGSHDGSRFAPLLIFNAGGIEGIRQTFKGAFAWLKLKSLATGAAGVSASVSGLSVTGDNSFTSLGVGTVGNDAYQVDLNFMGFGQLNGAVVVEGSLDGIGFNPIGEFASSGAGASLLGGGSGIEFSPVVTKDRVRYVRLNVQGSAEAGFLVTVGGAMSEAGGGAETLAEAYAAGMTSVDQTMIVLAGNGGRVVFDGRGLPPLPPFPSGSSETVRILGIPGTAQLTLGPRNIAIGMNGTPGIVNMQAGADSCVALGDNITVYGGAEASIAIGVSVVIGGSQQVAIGSGAHTLADGAVALGSAIAGGGDSVAIGSHSGADVNGVAIGNGASAYAANSIAMGYNARTGQLSEQNVVLGVNSVINDTDVYSNNVVVGHDVAAACSSSIAIGGLSAIGDVSIVSTADLAIGPSSACFGSYDVALGSGASVGTNLPLVTPSDYGTALGSLSSVMGQYGVAVGYDSSVTGDNGIAIGYLASAGAGEVVFSSSAAGGANKFEVVGSTAGNPDLVKFDVSSMFSGLDTSMFLLYKDTGGFVVFNQVKVQAATGYLYVPT
jgi:hypothetical protein